MENIFKKLFGHEEPGNGGEKQESLQAEKKVYTGENMIDPSTSEVVSPDELKRRQEERLERGREQL